MVTKNKKAVMAYLTPELERFVGDYCQRQGLTFTKDGETSPRLGTGIVELLESLRLGGNTSPPEVQDQDPLLSERLSKMEDRLGKLEGEKSPDKMAIANLQGKLDELTQKVTEHGPAIATLQGKLIGLESDLRALKRPPEPPQGEIEPPQIEPVTVVEVEEAEYWKLPFFGLEDGQVYSQKELAERLKHPGRTPQSIEIRKWIKDGRECLDPLIAKVIPHLSFSHSDGNNQPNFYLFTAAPMENNPI